MRLLKADGIDLAKAPEDGKKLLAEGGTFTALGDDPEHDGAFSGVANLEAAAKINDDEMRVPFTLFSERPMRDGHVVSVGGYSTAPWGKTGMPFLDSHGRGDFALGSMADVAKETGGDFRSVAGQAMFSKDPKHPTASVVFGLYRDGHQKAGSAAWEVRGFRMRDLKKESTGPDDTEEIYAMMWAAPMELTKTRGCEFSACPVGRHTDAMVKRASIGEAAIEDQLLAICRGVVGYNGGRNLTADESRRLVKATLAYLTDGAQVLAGVDGWIEVGYVVARGRGHAETAEAAREMAIAAGSPEGATMHERAGAYFFGPGVVAGVELESMQTHPVAENVSVIVARGSLVEPEVGLTLPTGYANLSVESFAILARAIPERIMKDFGLSGGAR